MKTLIIGAGGQLGSALCEAFSDTDVIRAEIDEGDVRIDVADADELHETVCKRIRPDAIVNTAAAHDVARCEKEPAWAFAVNAVGAFNVARASNQCGARLIHISTDYVFGDGIEGRPFVESDLPEPLSVYGASKLAGEHLVAAQCRNHCIVRTAGLYGLAPCKGKAGENFVLRMLRGARAELRVVDDEFTTPTYTTCLSRQIRVLAEEGAPGLYHVTCQGGCSWHEFAKAIFEEAGKEAALRAVSRSEFPSLVRRPRFSVLDNRRLREQGLDVMPHWRVALSEYLHDLNGRNGAQ